MGRAAHFGPWHDTTKGLIGPERPDNYSRLGCHDLKGAGRAGPKETVCLTRLNFTLYFIILNLFHFDKKNKRIQI